MAYTPEDGTGVAGANAYGAVSLITSYLTDRGREAESGWNGLSAEVQQEQAVRAADAIEKLYANRWQGVRATSTQGLAWPRSGVVVDGIELAEDAIPSLLIQAWAEYTIRAIGSTLIPDPPSDLQGLGPLASKSRTIQGAVVRSFSWHPPQRSGAGGVVEPSQIPSYPEADLLIQPLLRGSSIFGRVARA